MPRTGLMPRRGCGLWGKRPMTYRNMPRHRHRVRAARAEASTVDGLQRDPRSLLGGRRLW
eukprot:scaffold102230_cov52-Phaeocystis_antarctica.AAC.2